LKLDVPPTSSITAVAGFFIAATTRAAIFFIYGFPDFCPNFGKTCPLWDPIRENGRLKRSVPGRRGKVETRVLCAFLDWVRTDMEVRDELEELSKEIKASLKKIEELKIAKKPKAVLAERARLAEMRKRGRGLMLELGQIAKSAGEVNGNGRPH
jgi:hypothetical protein